MMGLIVVLHIIICIGLIGIVLVQRGRGGGFVEAFSGLESVFGTKTSDFLTKMTTIFAVTFFLTCLLLAFLSLKQSRSLMRDVKIKKPVVTGNVTEPPEANVVQQAVENATAVVESNATVVQNATVEVPETTDARLPKPRTGALK
jgi:preprotein translocase subunit SecG